MMKPILLAGALTLMGSPALADPDKDESGNHSSWDRGDDDRWDRRDRNDDDRWDRDDRENRGRYYARGRIPPGHLPPPGSCRVWLRDRPAGHQPPPMGCREARRYANRYGGRVIVGRRSY